MLLSPVCPPPIKTSWLFPLNYQQKPPLENNTTTEPNSCTWVASVLPAEMWVKTAGAFTGVWSLGACPRDAGEDAAGPRQSLQ